jgi:hypothetical protein
MAIISIGCEIGGPDVCMVADEKVLLYRALAEHVTSAHCSAIDEFALVLRVDGSLMSYGDEGIARVRFAKARRYITADIHIPQSIWLPMSRAELRLYLVRQVKAAVAACVSRLRATKCVIAAEGLDAEIEAATTAYLAS